MNSIPTDKNIIVMQIKPIVNVENSYMASQITGGFS